MNTQGLNLFIVDDNPLMVEGLRKYLDTKFGKELNISTFNSGKSALQNIDNNTGIVILDYYLNGENGNEVLKSIKEKNPKTEVIMLTSNDDIAVAIESFRKGAKDYVVKGEKAGRKLTKLIYDIISYPINVLMREFGVTKFVAIFLLTFVTMGIIVLVVLFSFNWDSFKR